VHPLIPIVTVGFVKVVDDFFAKGFWSRFQERQWSRLKGPPTNMA
jgi:hypothetical protein